ncbi:hypothetical protein [Pseudomonas putida]|uniref:Uncharacterized protein n=1 Tax=Pseudomonas putida TaxID=303 RepID=A0A6I6Y182_PSEPU|nr:hypothetical protein [Pseudomonas putida]QHG67407.1 hypothetical protein C2H86_24570 [Pseudomonas putida]
MTASQPSPPPTFKRRVAACFSQRPTLRAVLADVGFKRLIDRYPMIPGNYPQLSSLEGFTLLHAASASAAARHGSLLDELLSCLLTGQPLQLAASDALSLAPPAIFRAQQPGAERDRHPQVDLDMSKLNDDFAHVLSKLPEAFAQAQVSFWNGIDAQTQTSRLHWLAQLIKAALLNNIPRQGLDAGDPPLLYAMLDGADDGVVCNAVQVTFDVGDKLWRRLLPDLLLHSTEASSTRVLWCKPSGVIRAFANLPAFATALQDEFADRYRFDSLSWALQPLAEPAQTFQAMQLLNGSLDDLRRLRLTDLASIDELEARFAAACDPSRHFLEQPMQAPDLPSIKLPDWLEQADARQRYDYHLALLDLATHQGQARGSTSFDDVDDMQSYARRRLREQMRIIQPRETPRDPDQVFISIAQVLASSLPGQPQYLHLRDDSLTALAISRLGPGEVMTRITDPHGASHMGWLTLHHVQRLLDAVDIGGTYPVYLRAQVDDPLRKAGRISRYAREWRDALRFNVFKASIEQQLSEAARTALLDFCAAGDNRPAPLRLAPLAFLCAPGASASDRAHGMHLIELPASRGWVLYREFHADASLREYKDLGLLMDDIRDQADLQQSVLDALQDDALAVYENDGFTHPHLHPGLSSLAHLLGPDAALVATLLDNLRQPVAAVFKPWPADLDGHLFEARVQTMLHLASRRSVSNAQVRWRLLQQAAWALFNTATLLWHGPLASVTWLLLALSAARDDVETLANGNTDARVMAATDLLSNLAMVLAHRAGEAEALHERPATLRFSNPAERGAGLTEVQKPATRRSWETPTPEQQPVRLLESHWGNRQRLGNLSAERRQALMQLQAGLSLQGRAPLSEGRLSGLYEVHGRHYVQLADIAYEVQESWGGVRIIGPDTSKGDWVSLGGKEDGYHIVGRERKMGPWISRWNGEWSLSLNLTGGAPVKTPDNIEYFRLVDRLLANEAPLKACDDSINSLLTTLQPLDQQEIVYSRTFSENRRQPGSNTHDETVEMASAQERLNSLRAEHAGTIRAICDLYEQRVLLLQSNIDYIDLLKSPALQRFATVNYQAEIGLWHEALIKGDTQLYKRLLAQVSYDDINTRAMAIGKLPSTPAQRDDYATYRAIRAHGLAIHRRLLIVSERLDQSILDALEDPKIVYPDKASHLSEVTENRPYTTLLIHAQILSDLQALALDRAQLTAENVDSMYEDQQNLRNKDMHQALLSHDGLLRTDTSVDDQIAILESSLQQYSIGLGTTQYLLTLRHPAWNNEYLQACAREMTALKRIAERALDHANARRDAEQRPDWPAAGPAPAARPRITRRARLQVIRTSRQRTLLVDEALKDGKAVQYDPVARKPVAQFEAHGSTWVELRDQPGSSQKALRSLGTRLVAETDSEIARARLFEDEPNSLTDLLDHHIERLSSVAARLSRDASPALLDNLNNAIGRVQTAKRERLQAIYLATRHPDSKALRFLLEQHLVEIRPTVTRRRLADQDFLDVYTLYRTRAAGSGILWEAHFHYTRQDAAAVDFAKGHLKFATAKAREAQLEDALSPQERLKVYRGDMKYEQVRDLIPFPAR